MMMINVRKASGMLVLALLAGGMSGPALGIMPGGCVLGSPSSLLSYAEQQAILTNPISDAECSKRWLNGHTPFPGECAGLQLVKAELAARAAAISTTQQERDAADKILDEILRDVPIHEKP